MIERISFILDPLLDLKFFFTKIYICHSIIASEQLERGFSTFTRIIFRPETMRKSKIAGCFKLYEKNNIFVEVEASTMQKFNEVISKNKSYK